ncbi:MAG: glycosyltransferase [Actinomycetota bacterium]
MGPSVTVLTAVRDGAGYLAETIESIRAQSYEDWEHVIVDDASTDGTADIVAAVARDDPRICLIRRTTSGGPYIAANEGLSRALGRYVVLIDADDLAPVDRIGLQVSYLERNPQLRACTGSWRSIDETGRVVGDKRSPPSHSSRVLCWALPVVAGIVHSSLCAERSALVDLGGYAELSISADYSMWLSLARRGWLGVLEDVVVDYRKHDAGISTNTELLRTESLGILADHMAEMTCSRWAPNDVGDLWDIGRWFPTPLARGFDSLDRWERSWRADRQLSLEERRELRRLAFRLRLRHIRWNHGREFARVASGMLRWLPLQVEPRWRKPPLVGDSPPRD